MTMLLMLEMLSLQITEKLSCWCRLVALYTVTCTLTLMWYISLCSSSSSSRPLHSMHLVISW